MKDNVDKLFQERFSGHEVPVDPALWAAIEGQLLVSAATIDPVNELFKERFQGHELPVDPAVWEGIGRQLGHTPAPPASTTAWTWAASAAAVVVVGAGLWWGTSGTPDPSTEKRPTPTRVSEPVVETPAAAAEAAEATLAPSVAVESTPVQVPIRSPRQRSVVASHATLPSPAPAEAVPAEAVPTGTARPAEQLDLGVTPPPAQVGTPANEPSSDPQRVEAIIQEITERTLSEARSNPAPGAPPPPAADSEMSMAEAPELFMPNTFTPNGDGVNDTYELSMEGFERMSIRVLSLKNDKLVFSTTTGEPWTGAGCEDGMYVVVVEAVAEDGRSLSKGKVVWLTRERMN